MLLTLLKKYRWQVVAIVMSITAVVVCVLTVITVRNFSVAYSEARDRIAELEEQGVQIEDPLWVALNTPARNMYLEDNLVDSGIFDVMAPAIKEYIDISADGFQLLAFYQPYTPDHQHKSGVFFVQVRGVPHESVDGSNHEMWQFTLLYDAITQEWTVYRGGLGVTEREYQASRVEDWSQP